MLRALRHPATILAILALVLASAGGAAAAHLITGRDIAKGTITGANVKDGSLSVKDLSGSTRAALAGAAGPAGAVGPQGPAGGGGAKGDPGLKGDKGDAGGTGDGTVPSGQTVHGVLVLLGADAAADANGFVRASASFPAALPQPLVDSNAGQNVGFGSKYTNATTDAQENPNCAGSEIDPSAPAGQLCVYLAEPPVNVVSNTLKIQAGALGSVLSPAGALYGFQLRATPTAGNTAMVRAVWAYTAP